MQMGRPNVDVRHTAYRLVSGGSPWRPVTVQLKARPLHHLRCVRVSRCRVLDLLHLLLFRLPVANLGACGGSLGLHPILTIWMGTFCVRSCAFLEQSKGRMRNVDMAMWSNPKTCVLWLQDLLLSVVEGLSSNT